MMSRFAIWIWERLATFGELLFDIGGRSGTSRSRELYRAYDNDIRRSRARSGLWLAVGAYLPFMLTDLVLIPDVAHITIPARIAVAALALLAMELQISAGRRSAVELEVTCAVAVVMGYIVWLVPAVHTVHTEAFSHYAVFGAIFMMGVNLFFNFQFSLAVSSSAIICLCFLFSLSRFQYSAAYTIAFTVFYVCCFVFTSYVNWKLNRERFQVFLNAREAERQQRQAVEHGEALLHLSITDSLTGVGNRRAADIRLAECWDQWSRRKAAFAVLLVDVDHFKKYNDFYGHQQGDRCLRMIADLLALIVAPLNATVARYGGEEFIIIAELADDVDTASLGVAICEGIDALQLPHAQRLDGLTRVTVSVGAAVTQGTATKSDALISEADKALYRAKSDGRNCVRVFDPSDPQEPDPSEYVATVLRTARQQDLISLVYQPIQDLSKGSICAYEALMRLRLPNNSSCSPGVFIPIAERTGAIIELGYWAVETACRDIVERQIDAQISINVSPIQLRVNGFAAQIEQILIDTGVSGSSIAFEITEAVNMEIEPNIILNIEQLRRLGINIWLDDFGTGFAGLSWLRLTRFDMVKIDKTFLDQAENDPGASRLLEDIITLIRNRGYRILAEGVENDAQLELLKTYRVDAAQGFHIGYPAALSVLCVETV